MSQQIPKPPQAHLPGLGMPMRPAMGKGGAWNYPVNPFELQKELEFGIEHHKSGRKEEAERVYRSVLQKVPNQPDALNLLGVLAMEADNHEAAFDFLGRAIQARPKDPAILNNYGNALSLVRRYEEASEHLERAVAINPDMADAWLNLGRNLNMSGHPLRAIECFKRLQKLRPDSPSVQSGMVRALMELGRTEAAESAARELIAKHPKSSTGYVNLANTRKFKLEDPEVEAIEALLADSDTAAKEHRGLYFAAAKIYDDTKRFDNAFKYYDTANKLAGGTYDAVALERFYADLKKTYSRKFFEERRNFGVQSERPVFIVGMPRSGTTLLETVIGSHPQAFAAGELETIKRLEREMSTLVFKDEGVGKNARHLTWAGAEVLANRYLDVIDHKARKDAAIRVTDKMPHNFQTVGFIALLFPNARIIHSKRNPMDTCLSCWMQNFNDSHSYSRDLADAGHHYRQYQDLMAHWHEVLPGRILDVEYEDMVGNQEETSRKVIEHIGLPWDDAVLQFHKLDRTVLTASVWQVRQPIYKQSAGRWKNYEAHIGHLRKALGI
ncbi:MAG: tetratricopeptide repeat protein [Alphaproteobacteria bacterium]|nr:tetratricopeptide repeat protein [Alphaproteobacteria bacterium]